MTAIGTADAEVIVGLFVLIGTLAGLFVQGRKIHRENRSDHAVVAQVVADTAAKVDRLIDGQIDIKADVSDIKAEVRHHGERLRHLEAAATPKPTVRKKAAS